MTSAKRIDKSFSQREFSEYIAIVKSDTNYTKNFLKSMLFPIPLVFISELVLK